MRVYMLQCTVSPRNLWHCPSAPSLGQGQRADVSRRVLDAFSAHLGAWNNKNSISQSYDRDPLQSFPAPVVFARVDGWIKRLGRRDEGITFFTDECRFRFERVASTGVGMWTALPTFDIIMLMYASLSNLFDKHQWSDACDNVLTTTGSEYFTGRSENRVIRKVLGHFREVSHPQVGLTW